MSAKVDIKKLFGRKLLGLALGAAVAFLVLFWNQHRAESLVVGVGQAVVSSYLDSPLPDSFTESEAIIHADGKAWLILGKLEILDAEGNRRNRDFMAQIRNTCPELSSEEKCWTAELVRVGRKSYLDRRTGISVFTR